MAITSVPVRTNPELRKSRLFSSMAGYVKKSMLTILRALLALPGVGIKVASCVLLFGFHRLEAFPVDTWIRKALKQDYGPDFDPAKAFGPYAGIAQQYIFYHARGKNLA